VVFVPFANGKPSGQPEDFVTGWLVGDTPDTTWGRPVGVTVGRDGRCWSPMMAAEGSDG
jgi:glucose/arabinose dehydrogenase